MSDKSRLDQEGKDNIAIVNSQGTTIYQYYISQTGEKFELPISPSQYNSTHPIKSDIFKKFLLLDRRHESDSFFEKFDVFIENESKKTFFSFVVGFENDLPHNFSDRVFLDRDNRFIEQVKHISIEKFYKGKTVIDWLNKQIAEYFGVKTGASDFGSIWNLVSDKYTQQHLFLNIEIREKWTIDDFHNFLNELQSHFNIDYGENFVPIIVVSSYPPEIKKEKKKTFFEWRKKTVVAELDYSPFLSKVQYFIKSFSTIEQRDIVNFAEVKLKYTLTKKIDEPVLLKELWQDENFRKELAYAVLKY